VELTDQQIERYSRHIILQQIGGTGQEKLLSSKVLIIGAGGLGSPAALYLAAAGVGMIGIVDGDKVDLTNLQRQVIHATEDLGTEKVKSAEKKMRAINPDVTVHAYSEWLRADNIRHIIRQYDFVIDGTDNFTAKFLINDACYFEKIAFSHAGILRFDGQLITVIPDESACYTGRGAWCPGRYCRPASGDRGGKVPARNRRFADQYTAYIQRAENGLS
jgi:molybdopterin/thiamine biosynthesis adenylyltransferase